MRKTQCNEIEGFLVRGKFKVVVERDLPEDPILIEFALKPTGDGEVKFNACYVICGNRDRYKYMMVHSLTTVKASSSRLLFALCSMMSFNDWSADIAHAYLKSSWSMMRDE